MPDRNPSAYRSNAVNTYMKKDEAEMKSTAVLKKPKSFLQAIGQSFMSAIGSIVFGMEDGTVSIFGLVFGVAASATNSQTVLLAGATGAISAAVSMMAGTYLDISTERDQDQAEIAKEKQEIEQKPEQAAEAVRDRMLRAGFTSADAETVLTIIQRTRGRCLRTKPLSTCMLAIPLIRIPWCNQSGCSSRICLLRSSPCCRSRFCRLDELVHCPS